MKEAAQKEQIKEHCMWKLFAQPIEYEIEGRIKNTCSVIQQAFFLTLAAEKTKTQAQNSRKKLKHREAFSEKGKKSRKHSNLIVF